ncbi:hypothetical protein DDE01_00450 [Desulfovibrio desulfuricans]|jgi:hypothetical protein|nr:hypothetical protein DDE01_00450 [Desulfovibrio desulfuricans]
MGGQTRLVLEARRGAEDGGPQRVGFRESVGCAVSCGGDTGKGFISMGEWRDGA